MYSLIRLSNCFCIFRYSSGNAQITIVKESLGLTRTRHGAYAAGCHASWRRSARSPGGNACSDPALWKAWAGKRGAAPTILAGMGRKGTIGLVCKGYGKPQPQPTIRTI